MTRKSIILTICDTRDLAVADHHSTNARPNPASARPPKNSEDSDMLLAEFCALNEAEAEGAEAAGVDAGASDETLADAM